MAVRAVDARCLVLGALLGRIGSFARIGSGGSSASSVSAVSSGGAPTSEEACARTPAVEVRPDLPRPPRLRRLRGFGAWPSSPSAGAISSAPGSARMTSSTATVSATALLAEGVALDRPPRDRRRRCAPAGRVRATDPSPASPAGASGAATASGSTCCLGLTARTAGVSSPGVSSLCGPVDLVRVEGRRPDRRLRLRFGCGAPLAASWPAEESPPALSIWSRAGAVTSFICSLNARPFLLQDRAQALPPTAQEALMGEIRELDVRRGYRCVRELVDDLACPT